MLPIHAAAVSASTNTPVIEHLVALRADVNVKITAPLALATAPLGRAASVPKGLRKASLVQPVHLAAAAGHVSSLQFLVDRGSDIHARTDRSHQLLTMAAMSGHVVAAKYLLQRRADVAATADRQDCCQAIHIAAAQDFLSLVDLLVHRNADVNAMTGVGLSPRQLCQHQRVCTYIEDRLANVSCSDDVCGARSSAE